MANHNVIVNGPSKFNLMLSVFDGNCHNRRPIVFVLEHERPFKPPLAQDQSGFRKMVNEVVATRARQTKTNGGAITVVINQIEREDGSGENWNFRGYEAADGQPVSSEHVCGYYSTKSRSGWVEYP